MALQAAPASYIHVIADDDASPSPKRWRRGDTSVDHDSSVSSANRPKMVCCCFSSSPMPRCCLVAATSAAASPCPSDNAAEEWRAFCTAARVTRRIGTSLIQRQAASINRQLLSQHELVRSSQDDEEKSPKRRRMAPDETTSMPPNDSAHPDSPSLSSRVSTVTAASQAADHASRIWQQVDRMKRMALFLKNAQLAQSLLLEEMKEYYQAEAEAEAFSSDRPYPPEEGYDEGANYDAASHQDPQNNEEC